MKFNYFYIIIAMLLLLNGCNDVPNPAQKDANFDKEMELFYPLVEHSYAQRIESGLLFEKLEGELDQDGYLSAASIHALRQATLSQQKLREALLKRTTKYESWVEDESIEKNRRLKGIMFSLSAALVLYDNYLLSLSMFQNQPHLRKIINAEDSEYTLESHALEHASKAYVSVSNYTRMKKAMKVYQDEIAIDHNFDDEMVYFQTLIENSPSYHLLQEKNFFKVVEENIALYGKNRTDDIKVLSSKGLNTFSGVFGNTMGLVATRKGLMYQNAKIKNEIYGQLKAGDILLEKTPFRLTDSFIPGYWGHAAIWVGSEQELKELGLWEHPLVKPHQQEIRAQAEIVEALREGVVLNSLEHFLNIDDMAVLRQEKMSPEQKRTVILHTFAQLGKAYDFNFDVETSDKIVCSELIYTAYPHIKWPTSKTLGRYTISPNNIAQKTKSDQLQLVLLYHGGKRVENPETLWSTMLEDNL